MNETSFTVLCCDLGLLLRSPVDCQHPEPGQEQVDSHEGNAEGHPAGKGQACLWTEAGIQNLQKHLIKTFKSTETWAAELRSKQWDQIWQNFTLRQKLEIFGHFLSKFLEFGKL